MVFCMVVPFRCRPHLPWLRLRQPARLNFVGNNHPAFKQVMAPVNGDVVTTASLDPVGHPGPGQWTGGHVRAAAGSGRFGWAFGENPFTGFFHKGVGACLGDGFPQIFRHRGSPLCFRRFLSSARISRVFTSSISPVTDIIGVQVAATLLEMDTQLFAFGKHRLVDFR